MDNSAEKIKVAAVKTADYSRAAVEKSVDEAVALLGGWQKYIKPGDRVLIKPNMLLAAEPEKAVTTHPEVVRAVVRALKKLGASIGVGDSPGIAGVKTTAQKTGILEVCEEENVPFIIFKDSRDYPCPDGRFMKHFRLASALADFDKVISLPKMKTHVFMGVTGGVKNLFGCIVGTNKARFHLRMQRHSDFAHVMVDLYYTVKPVLTIIDGVSGMEGQGPMSGDIVHPHLLLASENALAADLVMADMMGFAAEKMPIAAAAIEQSRSPRLGDIQIVGSAARMHFSFVQPHTYKTMQDTYLPGWVLRLGQKQLLSRPVINSRCIGCGRCMQHCPAKAITMQNRRAHIDYAKCIRCYCCQELCEHQGVDLCDGFLLKVLKKIGVYH